jgi:glycosyltransferase involved in cell wall biosynthesis
VDCLANGTAGEPVIAPAMSADQQEAGASPPPAFRFTVFTPTRNRAAVLHRAYDSLCAQTFRDFEWLVIDNDPTDGTAELMARWRAEATFPIRYFVQDNRGVSVSWNRASLEARGELILFLRSADTVAPNALERFDAIWRSIPDDERAEYSGVTVNCEDEAGRLIGTEFPSPILNSNSSEIRFKYKVKGEKWGFQRVDIMRDHPLPVIDGYLGHVPEAIVWRAIGRRFKTRYVNERLRTYWQDQSGTNSGSRIQEGALGGLLDAEVVLNDEMRWFRYDPALFFRKAAIYSRCSFHVGRSIPGQWRHLRSAHARALWLVALPVGWL